MNSRSPNLLGNPYEELPEVRVITRAIRKALWPFDPGQITVNTTRSDMDILTIEIDLESLPKHPYRGKINILDIPDLSVDFYALVADLVYEHYTTLPRIAPDDHIILGTD